MHGKRTTHTELDIGYPKFTVHINLLCLSSCSSNDDTTPPHDSISSASRAYHYQRQNRTDRSPYTTQHRHIVTFLYLQSRFLIAKPIQKRSKLVQIIPHTLHSISHRHHRHTAILLSENVREFSSNLCNRTSRYRDGRIIPLYRITQKWILFSRELTEPLWWTPEPLLPMQDCHCSYDTSP